jgi:hypothetical protein
MKPAKRQYSGKSKWRKAPLLILFVLFAALAHAQDPSATFDDPNMKNPDSKSQKALAKKKKEEQKEADREKKAALKQHMKNQSKPTQKRMKEDAKQAERNRDHKREPFFKRLFAKKPGT